MDKKTSVLLSALLLALSACGGGDNADGRTGTTPPIGQDPQGKITLDLTDSPIDQATRVVIEFTGVTITSANGDAMHFNFEEPRQIDVLALQGGLREPLLKDADIPVGEYASIELNINAGMNADDSFVELETGGIHALHLPEQNSGLLEVARDFAVTEDGTIGITVDFDLRQSIFPDPANATVYSLRPALRAVVTDDSVSITGTISPAIAANELADPSCIPAVYAWEGVDAGTFDIGHESGPIATTAVESLDSGEYLYRIAYLPAGDYTVGLTCNSSTDTGAANDPVHFIAQEWVNAVDVRNEVDIDGDPAN